MYASTVDDARSSLLLTSGKLRSPLSYLHMKIVQKSIYTSRAPIKLVNYSTIGAPVREYICHKADRHR